MNDATPPDGHTPDAAVPDSETSELGAEGAARSFREETGESGANGSAISVTLSFELATINLPLSRLQAIQDGAVLDVASRDGSLPVRILANGRLLAHGTLVSIGDGYGVLVGERADRE